MQKESEERRNKVKMMDRLRVKNEKLSELEEEQRLKTDSLQRKSMMQLQENEEEIKRLNQVRKDAPAFVRFSETCFEAQALRFPGHQISCVGD